MKKQNSDVAQIVIPRCYDSHVHWLGTGEVLNLVNLSTLRSFEDFKSQAPLLGKPNRGQWTVGFGWDQSLWRDSFQPHATLLDQLFPSHPVAFIRADGHALWVNSLAMQQAQINIQALPDIPGGRIECDVHGKPTGVFVDTACKLIESQIPASSIQDMKQYLLQGMEVFYSAGFTHIRDVGGAQTHWELALEIEKSDELKLFCEMYFNLDSIDTLAIRIQEILSSRAATSPSSQLRVGGLKFFYDGALGSDGAYLSRPYPNGTNGLRLYELAKIEEVFHRCWEKKIPVAIHTLGDEAVHQIILVANRLKERGIEGVLNLEHCEVVRSETIHLMKSLNLRCHLQPSHFLSDRRWLKQKLGELYPFCFPWKKLTEMGIPISFGSDSPIEKPSLLSTQEALDAAHSEGVGLPVISPWKLHSHPDESWGARCYTQWDKKNKVQVFFAKS